jgi:hypothetical protein
VSETRQVVALFLTLVQTITALSVVREGRRDA